MDNHERQLQNNVKRLMGIARLLLSGDYLERGIILDKDTFERLILNFHRNDDFIEALKAVLGEVEKSEMPEKAAGPRTEQGRRERFELAKVILQTYPGEERSRLLKESASGIKASEETIRNLVTGLARLSTVSDEAGIDTAVRRVPEKNRKHIAWQIVDRFLGHEEVKKRAQLIQKVADKVLNGDERKVFLARIGLGEEPERSFSNEERLDLWQQAKEKVLRAVEKSKIPEKNRDALSLLLSIYLDYFNNTIDIQAAASQLETINVNLVTNDGIKEELITARRLIELIKEKRTAEGFKAHEGASLVLAALAISLVSPVTGTIVGAFLIFILLKNHLLEIQRKISADTVGFHVGDSFFIQKNGGRISQELIANNDSLTFAQIDHIHKLCAAEGFKDFGPDLYRDSRIKSVLVRGNSNFAIELARDKDRIVGYVVYWLGFGHVDIYCIAVHPEYFKKGIGLYLFKKAIDFALARGAGELTLYVSKSNTRALSFYNSLKDKIPEIAGVSIQNESYTQFRYRYKLKGINHSVDKNGEGDDLFLEGLGSAVLAMADIKPAMFQEYNQRPLSNKKVPTFIMVLALLSLPLILYFWPEVLEFIKHSGLFAASGLGLGAVLSMRTMEISPSASSPAVSTAPLALTSKPLLRPQGNERELKLWQRMFYSSVREKHPFVRLQILASLLRIDKDNQDLQKKIRALFIEIKAVLEKLTEAYREKVIYNTLAFIDLLVEIIPDLPDSLKQEAIVILGAFIKDGDNWQVRKGAAVALGKVIRRGHLPYYLKQKVIAILLGALTKGDSGVRVGVVVALGEAILGLPDNLKEEPTAALVALREDPDIWVRERAVAALDKAIPDLPENPLRQEDIARLRDPDIWVREKAAVALLSVPGLPDSLKQEAIAILPGALVRSNIEFGKKVAVVLGKVIPGSPDNLKQEATAILLSLTEDSEWEVRKESWKALGNSILSHPKQVRRIRQARVNFQKFFSGQLRPLLEQERSSQNRDIDLEVYLNETEPFFLKIFLFLPKQGLGLTKRVLAKRGFPGLYQFLETIQHIDSKADIVSLGKIYLRDKPLASGRDTPSYCLGRNRLVPRSYETVTIFKYPRNNNIEALYTEARWIGELKDKLKLPLHSAEVIEQGGARILRIEARQAYYDYLEKTYLWLPLEERIERHLRGLTNTLDNILTLFQLGLASESLLYLSHNNDRQRSSGTGGKFDLRHDPVGRIDNPHYSLANSNFAILSIRDPEHIVDVNSREDNYLILQELFEWLLAGAYSGIVNALGHKAIEENILSALRKHQLGLLIEPLASFIKQLALDLADPSDSFYGHLTGIVPALEELTIKVASHAQDRASSPVEKKEPPAETPPATNSTAAKEGFDEESRSRNPDNAITITIDGPSGAGKTTVAQEVAKNLNAVYFSYGKVYRLITWLALEKNINLSADMEPGQVTGLIDIAGSIDLERFSSRYEDTSLHYFYCDRDITGIMYSKEIADNVAFVSAIPQLRKVVVKKTQAMLSSLREKGISVVLEGRVTGIEIAPWADVKIFLTAGLEIRARRRAEQMIRTSGLAAVYLDIFKVSNEVYEQRLAERKEDGLKIEIIEAVKKSIKDRDDKDSARKHMPATIVLDAVTIDATDSSVNEIAEAVLGIVTKVKTQRPSRLPMYSLEELRDIIEKGKSQELILISEAKENRDIALIARRINQLPSRSIILLSGPSSSGKTTLAERIHKRLKKSGRELVTLNVDNYYKDITDRPQSADGSVDWDSPEALDIALLNRHLKALLNGETIAVPHFDMKTNRRTGETSPLRLEENQILIIEGILAVHPAISDGIEPGRKFSIYVDVSPTLRLRSGEVIASSDVRLIRRIVRDAFFRGTSAIDTIRKWPLVIRGEARYIYPEIEQVDLIESTYLPYELSVLKGYIMPLLEGAQKQADRENDLAVVREIIRLKDLLEQIPEISKFNIPEDSILREFLGDNIDLCSSAPAEDTRDPHLKKGILITELAIFAAISLPLVLVGLPLIWHFAPGILEFIKHNSLFVANGLGLGAVLSMRTMEISPSASSPVEKKEPLASNSTIVSRLFTTATLTVAAFLLSAVNISREPENSPRQAPNHSVFLK
ncbi:MAG: GNAT family N-acetyltransferase, partial [Candidatus Omnitrophota bacterium]